jgi:hypothetical protein
MNICIFKINMYLRQISETNQQIPVLIDKNHYFYVCGVTLNQHHPFFEIQLIPFKPCLIEKKTQKHQRDIRRYLLEIL